MAGRGELTDLQRRVFQLDAAGVARVVIARELRVDRGTPGRFLRNPRLRELWREEQQRAALVYVPEVVGHTAGEGALTVEERVAIRHMARGRVWRVLERFDRDREQGGEE